MSWARRVVLTAGPLALIVVSYAICWSSGTDAQDLAYSARIAAADMRARQARINENVILTEACSMAAADLAPRLPDDCRVIVRSPFVIAGNFTDAELDRLHREALLPITAALWRAFFDRKPDQPVVVVLLSDEAAYHRAAERLDHHAFSAYAGYTQRSERRIVINLDTGYGTLAHELTHVLALFDFPEMPEWFDEGLGALHEEASFSEDGLILHGTSNWRLRVVLQALAADTLPTLESVIRAQSFRGEQENLNYALTRCFCHYLQERGMLCHYYRKFRSTAAEDPSGLKTLCELLNVSSCDALDADFRRWLHQIQ